MTGSGSPISHFLSNLCDVSVARNLERRLEKLIEGVAGRMFSGRLHPSELAGKLAREADFARFEHTAGTATANRFLITLHPRDLTIDPSELGTALTEELNGYVVEEGLRIAGPIDVEIVSSDDATRGATHCHVEVVPGPGETWGRLSGGEETHEIDRIRTLIGRSEEADVRLHHDNISRFQAVIFRQHGEHWIRDLGSANGTYLDGHRLTSDAATLNTGSTVSFADNAYRVSFDDA